jgi:acetyl esterase
MPLHPQAREFLQKRDALGVRPVDTLSVDEAREQTLRIARAMGPGEPVASVDDHTIPGPDGAIPVRLYEPAGRRPFPVLVFFHGGGWVVGNLETADFFCRMITNAAGCVVASVNYRHAPEHRFPAAAEDAYAATRWLVEHAAALGGDAHRLAVAGTSAGGNLAAAVAQMARDRGGPVLHYQVLLVPVTDCDFTTVSYRDNAEGYGLTTDAMRWYWQHYVPRAEDRRHPHASPLRASSLRDLPPAFVATAEFDPLRDEGEAYAARLRAEGVPTTHRRYEGMVHGFWGPAANAEIAGAIRGAFAQEPKT